MNEHEINGEEPLRELIRMAGPRPRVPEDTKARVRAAVHGEWQQEIARRKRVRMFGGAGLAAAATIAGVIFLRPQPTKAPVAPVAVARVQSIDGSMTATVGETLMAGRVIETAIGSTASIQWGGATLRLDRDTRVRLDSARVATLESGAVYFADDHSGGGAQIRTSFGVIHDIGTQFEVRLQSDSLRVRVREGRVSLVRAQQSFSADAGTELTATANDVQTRTVQKYGGDWSWTEKAAPPILLEGMTLGELAAHVAHEKGLTVQWERSGAAAKRLHGDTPLSLDEALQAASTAAGVQYRIEGDRLVIR